MKPKKFYDLVVEVALIRPGPIVGNMVHPYLARRAGREPVDALHPMLEPVLARTLGVPLFQEQLLRMAMIAANFSGGEAEELRRAMGFKRSKQRMQEIETKLRAGMAKNGITGETQDRIVQSITSFALYGFPESHAASFALLAYASAYFKCHYLAAFTCALLEQSADGLLSSRGACQRCAAPRPARPAGRRQCFRMGLHRRRRRSMRFASAFAMSADCGPKPGKPIAAAKPFTRCGRTARRVPQLRQRRTRKTGRRRRACKLSDRSPPRCLWKAGRAGRPAGPLLEEVPENAPEAPLEQMTTAERLSADYNGTGLTVGRHPMHFRRAEMNELGVTPRRDLARSSATAAWCAWQGA